MQDPEVKNYGMLIITHPCLRPINKGPQEELSRAWKMVWYIIQILSRTNCGDSSRNLLKDSKEIANTIPDPLIGIWMTGSL